MNNIGPVGAQFIAPVFSQFIAPVIASAFSRLIAWARGGVAGSGAINRAPTVVALCCLLATVMAPAWSGSVAESGSGAVGAQRYQFERLDQRNGLSQASVLAIAQDAQGFMWFGTQYGLNRYDGHRFKVFRHDDSDAYSLSDHYIKAMALGPDGRLYLATQSGGLNRYDPRSEHFQSWRRQGHADAGTGTDTRTVPASNQINALLVEGDMLWLGSEAGLQRFATGTDQFHSFERPAARVTGAGAPAVTALARTTATELMVGTRAGLYPFAPGAGQWLSANAIPIELQSASINALLVDGERSLWVGSNQGLWRRDPSQRWQRYSREQGQLADDEILALYQDRAGAIWAGSFAGGLLRIAPGSGELSQIRHNVTDGDSLGEDRIPALFQDRSGSLWVGTWTAGVARVDLAGGGFLRYRHDPKISASLSDNRVYDIAEQGGAQKAGSLWLATLGGGLNRLDLSTGKFTLYRHDPADPNSLPDDIVSSVLVDSRQRLWAGTRSGLARLLPDGRHFQRWRHIEGAANGLNANRINVMAEAGDGALWLASVGGGLNRFEPDTGRFQSWRAHGGSGPGLSADTILALLAEPDGSLWLGTDLGLDYLTADHQQIQHYRHDPTDAMSLPHDRVTVLMRDRKGRLWLGTGAGVAMARTSSGATEGGPLRFRRYGKAQGLAAEAVGGIVEDERGQLWLSTIEGISRLDPDSGVIRNYGHSDGTLPGGYYIGAYQRGANGEIYFGGMNGLTRFRPTALSANPQPPELALTELLRFNQPVRPGAADGLLPAPLAYSSELTLKHDAAVFAFEFAALHYADSRRNRYAYRLDGFDQDWIATDADNRRATYTNLDPGAYVFRVKAANKDGLWNDDGVQLALTVLPPWWASWWCRLVLALVTVGSAALLYRWRLRRVRVNELRLQRQVNARTRELEDARNNIASLSEMGREINATLAMESIFQTLYTRLNTLMDAESFAIGLLDDTGERLLMNMAMQRGQRVAPFVRDMRDKNQLSVWCIRHGQAVLIDDLEQDHGRYIDNLSSMISPDAVPAFEDGHADTARAVFDGKAFIYVPLQLKERVIGVVVVFSRRRAAFQKTHVDMLQTLASYAATAIDNAQSHEQLSAAHRALQTTHSELKSAQDQLVLQEKMASLGTLTAGVAHEINNPTNFSHVAAQNLEIDLLKFEEYLTDLIDRDEAPELAMAFTKRFLQLHNHIATVLNGTTRIKAIVRDLRAFTRLDESEKQTVDISANLQSTLNLVRASYLDHIEFELVLADAALLDCYPAQLNQVFMNLIVNACQAVLSKASVNANSAAVKGKVSVRTFVAEDAIIVDIEDNGIGMSPDIQARILEPFFTTKSVSEGTGLGLSISYGILRKHDGELQIRSEPGRGSLFTVILPRTPAFAPVNSAGATA